MSLRGTTGLVVAFAILAGAYWYTGQMKRQSEQRALEAKRVFQFAPADLESVTIERVGEAPLSANQSTPGMWNITAPHDGIEPNQIVWNRVATALSGMSNDRSIADAPTDLSVYELDPPFVTVIADTTDGREHRVVFGGLDATQEKRYAQVDGGAVFLTPAKTYAEFDRPLDDFRNRYIAPQGAEGLDRIEYSLVFTGARKPENPESRVPEIGEESLKVIVERDDKGIWQMASPVVAKANQERVDALVKEVQFAIGRNYIDAPASLKDYGLDPPERLLTVRESATDKSVTLMLGWAADAQQGNGVFVKKKDLDAVFVVDGHLLTLLPGTPEEFREAHLLSGEAKNLASITYRDAANTMRLENNPQTGWQLVTPTAPDADQYAINSYISFLKDTGGNSFPDPGQAFGFDAPKLTLEFEYVNAGAPTSIVVGALVPGAATPEYYVKQEDGAVTTVPMPIVEAMESTSFKFRRKDLMPFRPESAEAIDLTFESERFVLRKVNQRWAITDPQNVLIESQSDVDALLRALARVNATGVADPAPALDVQGLDSPVLSATVTVAPPGQQAAALGPLRIGNLKASASRDRFASVAGRDEVFFVDQDAIDQVRAATNGFVAKE